MTTSLQPGSVVGRFRVVSLLGAGGMGQVYLARDESLDRSVALKILPPELVKNDERVRRFVQEAKSASSLSHPNIVTIHEIGEADVDSSHVHFIAMELVAGSTLKDLIHTKNTDLRTLVRYLAQAAEGIAKAHAAGIVHRDLKPENIMVTDDGFAKVLDFGLAKLTETGAGTITETKTALGSPTDAGMILGTVGYMSPEQVQAKPLDHRSDIFSFGCILYEAATRQRPFKADSDIETLHQIVKEKPTAVEELNAQVPTDVRRLIRRCLAKTPEQRLQSMKDLALELAEIAEQYDTLSVSTGSGATTWLSGARLAPPARSPWERVAIAAAFVVGIGGLAFGGWAVFDGRGSTAGGTSTFGTMEVTRLASIPDLSGGATLSPDGRYLAYATATGGTTRIVVRQLATGRDLEVASGTVGPWQVEFSPDGNYLFYDQRAGPDDLQLYQVASLGGTPRRIDAPRLTGGWTTSRDGTQILGTTNDETAKTFSLVVISVDATSPRTVKTFKPGEILSYLAWSPDGQRVVTAIDSPQPGRTAGGRLIAVSTKDGSEQPLGSDVWSYSLSAIRWLPDGTGVIVAGSDLESDSRHIWLVSWPDGARRRITNDATDYFSISVTADSQSIGAVNYRGSASIWTAPVGNLDKATRISSDAGSGFTATRDGSVLFVRGDRGRRSIWSVPPGGGPPRRLTPERLDTGTPKAASAADLIVFPTYAADGSRTFFQIRSDGEGLAEIPFKKDKSVTALSPDGRTVYFSRVDPVTNSVEDRTLWKMPIGGGPEERVADDRSRVPMFAPDGTHFYRWVDAVPARDAPRRMEVFGAGGQTPVRVLDFWPDGYTYQWTASSDAITVVRDVDGVPNIWRMPIDGRPAQQVTRFTDGQFDGRYAWTADGSRLIFNRQEHSPTDVVLIKNFR